MTSPLKDRKKVVYTVLIVVEGSVVELREEVILANNEHSAIEMTARRVLKKIGKRFANKIAVVAVYRKKLNNLLEKVIYADDLLGV